MRRNQASITFYFHQNKKLQQELFQYLRSQPNMQQNQALRRLLTLGLAVENGQYHDHELGILEHQHESLIRQIDTLTEITKHVIDGQADIQDAITGQLSDTDLVLSPHHPKK